MLHRKPVPYLTFLQSGNSAREGWLDSRLKVRLSDGGHGINRALPGSSENEEFVTRVIGLGGGIWLLVATDQRGQCPQWLSAGDCSLSQQAACVPFFLVPHLFIFKSATFLGIICRIHSDGQLRHRLERTSVLSGLWFRSSWTIPLMPSGEHH